MKTLLTIAFAFLNLCCFGQTRSSNEALYKLTVPYRPATIKIMNDTNPLDSFPVLGIEKASFAGIKPGHYKIHISWQGQPTVIKDSIIVAAGQMLVLDLIVDGPCVYDHPTNYIPVCPKKHTDNIIPIVYGLIASVVKRGSPPATDKDMKVKHGGCVSTGCDAKFYCKEHDIEF